MCPIEQMVEKHLKQLCDNLSNGEKISDEQIERILNLKTICNTFNQKEDKRNPWFILTVFLSVLVIISALLFINVGDTRIDADLLLSGLSFSPISKSQIISSPIAIESASLSGIQRAFFPPQANQKILELSQPMLNFQHNSATPNSTANNIVLNKVVVAKEDTIELMREKDQWILKIYNQNNKPIKSEISLSIQGEIAVRYAEAESKMVYSDPVLPQFLWHPSGFKLQFMVSKGINDLVIEQLAIDYLSLSKRENLSETSHPVFSWRSSIVAGDLYLEELKGEKLSLRYGENLQLDLVSGTVRLVKTEAQHLRALFHGTTRELYLGEKANALNLMPTLLELAKSQKAMALLWFSSLYVFGIVYTAIKWWKGF
ncbi:hypothetical protein DSCW_32060 [Desulfosarcina widdelii]|uniref:Uncharacterized protein n=1 Tax=Desulfosarcina widdelii TaxID=947919 RepID=A0A5K7Z6G2_9BACT|nr:hypothetical protein DSCW_32060 [Desulfosarcina widdelii]